MARPFIIVMAILALAGPQARAAAAPAEACCPGEALSIPLDEGPGGCCPDGCRDCSRPCCGGARIATLDAPRAAAPPYSTPLALRPLSLPSRVAPASIFHPPPAR